MSACTLQPKHRRGRGHGLSQVSALRPQIERAIDLLIGLLDAVDGNADAEPSLGCPNDYDGSAGQVRWAFGLADDREGDGAETGIADLDGLLEQIRPRASYTWGGHE